VFQRVSGCCDKSISAALCLNWNETLIGEEDFFGLLTPPLVVYFLLDWSADSKWMRSVGRSLAAKHLGIQTHHNHRCLACGWGGGSGCWVVFERLLMRRGWLAGSHPAVLGPGGPVPWAGRPPHPPDRPSIAFPPLGGSGCASTTSSTATPPGVSRRPPPPWPSPTPICSLCTCVPRYPRRASKLLHCDPGSALFLLGH